MKSLTPAALLIVLIVTLGNPAHGNFILDKKTNFLELMKRETDISTFYLLKSFAYKDQSQERKGLSKLLRAHSDALWDEALSNMKKFNQRGGQVKIADLAHFNIDVPKKDESSPYIGANYTSDLRLVRDNTNYFIGNWTELYQEANSDADMLHYLEEKLEAKTKTLRDVTLLYNGLSKMEDNAIAQHIFDLNL